MNTETKERIASRFFRYPVVCMLVRTLLYSFWFQLCFVGLLLLPVVLVLVLAKVWRTTPAGFLPVVRISGVDWVQTKSLQRTALRDLQNGHTREGLISYNVAVAINPGDLPLLRGFLQQIARHAEAPHFQGPALGRAFWLLRLTQTNGVDLELASAVFEKYGLEDYLIRLLKIQEPRLTVPLQKVYLRALFNTGRVAEFNAFWRSLESREPLLADLETKLYRAAFLEGWRPRTGAEPMDSHLKDYLNDPAYWDTLSAVAFELKDADLLLKSTEKAIALSPGSWVARNNYAAALMLDGRCPEESIQHTFALLTQRPAVLALRINHALALIQNHRHAEAEHLLAGINSQGLTESERALYDFGCFEVLVRQERFNLASAFLRELHSKHLFPCQKERLAQLQNGSPRLFRSTTRAEGARRRP